MKLPSLNLIHRISAPGPQVAVPEEVSGPTSSGRVLPFEAHEDHVPVGFRGPYRRAEPGRPAIGDRLDIGGIRNSLFNTKGHVLCSWQVDDKACACPVGILKHNCSIPASAGLILQSTCGLSSLPRFPKAPSRPR